MYMANIATNEYLFYGDKNELNKLYKSLNDKFEECGSNYSCVDCLSDVKNNAEWIEYIERKGDDIVMCTTSKWYGNPIYWRDFTKSQFPKLSVAFRCEECGMGIFEKVDPDNKFGNDLIYLCNMDISKDELDNLPKSIVDLTNPSGQSYYLCGILNKSEIFNDEFTEDNLPDGWDHQEFIPLTYEEIENSYCVFKEALPDVISNVLIKGECQNESR